VSDEKHLIIHFNNGTDIRIAFPTQIKNSAAALIEGVKTILSSEKLVIQADDRVMILPWSSVKYVEATAIPGAALPFGAIKGARIVSEAASASADTL
jgi:hypothetical protein